ncbi:MAG: type II toxin-antitoxin system VapC family toxin [Deltaproteobacteria bacterium]|nr:type II toxin-antitoxin system VapC family toxin [Deltaproteobacteria bacterium]
MYLLDTDTLIYNLKGNDSIKRNLELHLEDPIKISVITLMELYFGAYKSEKVTGNLAKIRRIENSFEIVSTGKESAQTFGMLKASLKKSGSPLDDFDLLIASCAMAHNLTLVTNNTKHFSRIDGLKLTNWTIYPG